MKKVLLLITIILLLCIAGCNSFKESTAQNSAVTSNKPYSKDIQLTELYNDSLGTRGIIC